MHVISEPIKRSDSAAKSSGTAAYISDLRQPGMLWLSIHYSDVQHAEIVRINYPDIPEGYRVVSAEDFPGIKTATVVAQDWPFFALGEVLYFGQPVIGIAGPDKDVCESLCSRVRIDYKVLPAVSSLSEATEWFNDYTIIKGDPDSAFDSSARVFENSYTTGMQEQAYMEPQGMIAEFNNGKLTLTGSLQCPYYIKNSLINAFALDSSRIRVKQAETGGAFGGKEDYPSLLAGQAAAAAMATGKPVKIILDRRNDMAVTPKRHPSDILFKTAVDSDGNITAVDIDCRLDAGAYQTLSGVVLERAIFICTGAYNIPNVRVRGRTMKTNHVPSGAFRGFGGPQALFAAEMNMYYLARELSIPPLDLKRRYLFRRGDLSVTGGTFRDEIKLEEMIDKIEEASSYSSKWAAYNESGSAAGNKLRGIGISFAAHGGAFTGSGEQDIIKSVVRLEADLPAQSDDRKGGKTVPVVRLLVSNVEMGQGASVTLRKIVARAMNIPYENTVYITPDTDIVPDSGPTVASRTVMIVGKLLHDAAVDLAEKISADPGKKCYSVERRYVHPEEFRWDESTFTGDAYPGYSWSVNVIEVEVDSITYEIKVTGSWAVYDVGTPIDLRILKGQMQGGTAQSLGYSSIEKMQISNGKPAQASFTDYTIPTTLDFPDTECYFVDNPYRYGPFGAKAAGELPNEGPAGAFAAAVSQAVGKMIGTIPVTPELLEEASNG